MTQPPSNPGPGTGVLAIHPGALGDVVLFGRLLASLDGDVRLFARGGKAELLAGLRVVREAGDFDALPFHECFTENASGRSCRLGELLGTCDRLISCFAAGDGKARTRLTEMTGARQSCFLSVRPPADFFGHLLEYWQVRLREAFGSHTTVPAPRAWPVPGAWRAEAADILVRAGGKRNEPYAVLHPDAGAQEKCWPLERFAGLAGRLAGGAPPVRPVFVLGPVEADRWAVGQATELGARFPVLQHPSLPSLAGLLAGAAAFVGNDSGPAHLAAAVGTPTLALFGPTDPARFAPVGPTVRVLRSQPLENLRISPCEEALRKLACLEYARKE